MKTFICSIIGLLLIASFADALSKVTIDAFTERQSLQVTVPDVNPPSTNGASIAGSMIGGERDLQLQGNPSAASAGLIVLSQVNNGDWYLACQRDAPCLAFSQYDGVDNSRNLRVDGLGTNGYDFTNNGANAITITANTDIATFYNITFYEVGTSGSKSVSYRLPIAPSSTANPVTYIIPFTDFTGVNTVNFARIGSFVVYAEGGADVDSFVRLFQTYANDLSGNVFKDCNENGIKDSGEVNLPSQNVTLYDCGTTNFRQTRLTDANGNYIFPVSPGCYKVCALLNASFEATSPATGCVDNILVTILADSTGNNLGFTQPVTVVPPPNRSLACGSSTLPASTGTATGTGCVTPTITFSDVSTPGCGGTVSIARTWTATAGAESDSEVQTIVTTDTTNPTFASFPNNVTVACNIDYEDPANTGGSATGADTCSSFLVTHTDAALSSICNNGFLRTWTVTDACGNALSRNQLITVRDNVAPTFDSFPNNQTLTCNDGSDPATTGSPTSSDNCDLNPAVTRADTSTTTACTTTITRRWTTTDDCGNAFSRNQRIALTDGSAPTFEDFPSDSSVPCGTSTDPVNTGGSPTADDDCSTPTVTRVDTTNGAGTCGAFVSRNWTAADACGNRVSQVQRINLADNVAPNIQSFPQNITGTCTASTNPTNTGRPTINDACTSTVTPTFSDDVSSNGCTTTILRTWTMSDICGNTVTRNQLLTLTDTRNPSFSSFPANRTVQCNDATDTTATGSPVPSDDCDTDPEVTSSDSTPSGTACSTGIIRTWTVTDACGNSFSQNQAITITDTVRPAFVTFPDNTTVQCTDSSDPANTGSPTASDNCDINPEITRTDSQSGSLCPNGIDINRVWRVTDSCGNFITRTQLIEVELDQLPSIVVPNTATIDCGTSTDPSNTGGLATGSSPCTGVTVTVTRSDSSSGSCPVEVTRTWTATDSCGNVATDTQLINVQDLTNPVVNAPNDITIDCTDDADDLSTTGRATASDSCAGTLTPTYSDSETTEAGEGICPGDTIITRTWTATDPCGNIGSDTQIITVSGVSIGSCRPVDCTPVACDASNCPSCGNAPACTASACTASNCQQQDCTAQICSGCTAVCQAKPCSKVQYVYVDDLPIDDARYQAALEANLL